MQSIVKILSSIVDWIVIAFDFVFGFFEDIVYIGKITGVFLRKIPEYFAWLPSQCIVLVVLIFSIVVLYKILGREG